ncbi:asparagine synthase-related protein [Promineifilum sp.]|uniref:asparagine synthase-related protein n=1 Tax=Promineifilum sp. TaxID=2664178 RepID=UPI0035B4ECE4
MSSSQWSVDSEQWTEVGATAGYPLPAVHYSLLGDWLLTFDGGPTGLPARHAAWQAALTGDGWQLHRAPTATGWRGMPSLSIETEGWAAWLVGELYATPDPAAAVLDVLAGRADAGALNGHFHLLAHERAANEWHVWTNRHATLHAYLGAAGGRVALGTFAPAVAAAAGCDALDWEGLASFFAFGFFAADRTHLTGLRILRPATHYRFDSQGRLLAAERYWQWRYEPDARRDYEATLAEFADLFGRVMRDLTADGRIAVPISGGLDSRSTVAPLAADAVASGRLWAYSYGYHPGSIETRLAGQVAAARRLPFDAFTLSPYLFDRLPDVLAAVEGFEDVTQCRQAGIVDEIGRHADYLIAAHLGDLYLADMGLTAIDGRDDAALLAAALHKLLKGGRAWLLTHLVQPQLGATPIDEVLRNLVAGELENLRAVGEPDFRIKAFKVDQWCARWTTVALRMFQPVAFPRLPFYDTRLADFFLTVPTEYVRGRRLQLDYLRRYAPDLARVPWQATGRDLYHTGGDNALDAARRAAHKGWRWLSNRSAPERNWEVQFLGQTGRAGLRRWLLGAHVGVHAGAPLHEFVAPRAVADLLAAFERDPYTDKRGYTVSMLLTFSAWLERQAPGSVR